MKIGIFSCNMGGICDNTITPQSVDFTFHKWDNTTGKQRNKAMHPRLEGKILKMLAWEYYDYDVYIWIDAPFNIKNPNSVQWYLDQLGDKDAAFFTHPNRKSVKEELEFMEYLMKKGDQYLISRYENEPMKKQVEDYLSDFEYTDNELLACTSFIYSKKLIKNRTNNVLKEWFYHNCTWSVQDQLSLPYLLQKYDVNYNVIQGDSYKILEKL